ALHDPLEPVLDPDDFDAFERGADGGGPDHAVDPGRGPAADQDTHSLPAHCALDFPRVTLAVAGSRRQTAGERWGARYRPPRRCARIQRGSSGSEYAASQLL